MEANELMIGDWVKNMVHGTYCKVDIDALKLLPKWPLEPIPLSAKILKKNGLDKVPELSMVLNRDTMPMYHSPMLHSVHELQHALRLCGLNDLADNFKI